MSAQPEDHASTVAAADAALVRAQKSQRAQLHLQRLHAINLGSLGEASTREKEAIAACTNMKQGIDVRLALGEIALKRGDYATAHRLGKTMQTLIPPDDHVRLAEALLLQATAKWSFGELEEAIALYTHAAELSMSDALAHARALDGRGFVRGYMADYDRALADHEAARGLAEAAPDGAEKDRTLAQIYNSIGFARAALHQPDALTWLERALALREALHDPFGEAITQNNIGNVHRTRGRAELASAAYEKALALCTKSGNKLYEAVVLNNVGAMAADAAEWAHAQACFQRALVIAQTLGDKIREADNLGNLGAVWLQMDDLPRALPALERAVRMRRQAKDTAYLIVDLAALALGHARTGESALAQEELAEVEDALAKKPSGIERIQAVYLDVALAHRALGNEEKAAAAIAVARAHMDTSDNATNRVLAKM